jgi:signal transduction histidine kinase/ActR/RegA family two-component response regulator
MNRIDEVRQTRRTYNQWVANETMEDFALRFTARRARKWSPARVANTAIGSISFLALEAIGGAITLSYGFDNAVVAILVVGAILFLTAVPISYHAARAGVDIDLLTRGAGFGYIGSTITSLIYASFTFIFFALEAAILSFALQLCFGVPLEIGYLLNALVVIPLVTHGFTRIGAFQKWTQPVWVALHAVPFLFLLWAGTDLAPWLGHEGRMGEGAFDVMLFAAAASVIFALAAQIGEQVDFLRFLPEPRTPRERLGWWAALMAAGPGWAVLGTLKMLAGSLLAVLALGAGVAPEHAAEPTRMYLVAFETALPWEALALFVTGVFVVISQLKINVTNAYAGSIAWSNFFSRLTHSHPGRVVWLCFNVLIALMLMEFGVFGALENTLGMYAHVAVAWVGALVADLTINKPLGLSPRGIEFRRACLYDVNPVGVGAMGLATVASLAVYLGVFGSAAEPFSSFVALGTALVAAPAIAWGTGGRYYIARRPTAGVTAGACTQCGHAFDAEDMVDCPFHGGAICSLCCTLDARCNDRCKPGAPGLAALASAVAGIMPRRARRLWRTRYGLFAAITAGFLTVIGAAFLLIHQQVALTDPDGAAALGRGLLMAFCILVLVVGVAAWLHVLAIESRVRALGEAERQTSRLVAEIAAHERTDAELQKAKEDAEAANEAKSRYVVGISHELRTPLNAILGYAQLMEDDPTIPPHRRAGVGVIRRSAEHLGGLIEGLLDISRIEAGRLEVHRDQIRLGDCLDHIAAVFRMQAAEKGLAFETDFAPALPRLVTGDEKRLRQILMNLLSNAVRYTDEGRVRLSVAYASETATFVIEDTGRGIPPEEVERIFQPFERIEDPVRPVRGTGLGLTITKLLTEMLGGDLALDSAPGRGSRFTVRLMLPRVHGAGGEAAAEAEATDGPITGYAGPARRILVVDDTPEHRGLVADALRPLGFTVTAAESAAAAEAVLEVTTPDLILLDVAMPGTDGWSFLRRLREERGLATPVFMVSAHAFDRGAAEGERPRHDAFIAKPVRIDALVARIGQALELSWTRGTGPELRAEEAPARPPAALLGPLAEAARINHPAGVRAALARIGADGAHAGFVAEAEAALARFDFDAIRGLAEPEASA